MKPVVFTLLLMWSVGTFADIQPYQHCFEVSSRMYDVPLDLLLAVAATESNYDPDARSHANAHGIMQIQWPGTAQHLGVRRVSELYNPCLNISLGARYLRELLDRNDGDVERSLASYNYGPTRIDASPSLPEGAQGYANKVEQKRATLVAGSSSTKPLNTSSTVMFDSELRARRFAKTLNRMIASAVFDVASHGGAHIVSMRMKSAALSYTDVRTLTTLGWPELTP